jgi:hypothetical protein
MGKKARNKVIRKVANELQRNEEVYPSGLFRNRKKGGELVSGNRLAKRHARRLVENYRNNTK